MIAAASIPIAHTIREAFKERAAEKKELESNQMFYYRAGEMLASGR